MKTSRFYYSFAAGFTLLATLIVPLRARASQLNHRTRNHHRSESPESRPVSAAKQRRALLMHEALTSRSAILPWERMRLSAGVLQRLAEYGPTVRARLLPYFDAANVSYPPSRVELVAFKRERRMEVYAAGPEERLKLIRSYSILAASGTLGPKLRRGDHQVPEGFYRIEGLNPFSRFHLALHVGYPNSFDLEEQEQCGMTGDPGGDIMIHGKHSSAGCLAMGDPASEDLFVLAADTGPDNLKVVISPVDFRTTDLQASDVSNLPWLPELYRQLHAALDRLP